MKCAARLCRQESVSVTCTNRRHCILCFPIVGSPLALFYVASPLKGQVTEENYKQVLVGLDLKYLEALGKINEAVQRVATIEDTDPIIRSILTGIFIRAKRFEEAQQRIETLKAITTPTPQMPLRNLSQLIQDLQKQYDEAMASPAYPPQTNSRT